MVTVMQLITKQTCICNKYQDQRDVQNEYI